MVRRFGLAGHIARVLAARPRQPPAQEREVRARTRRIRVVSVYVSDNARVRADQDAVDAHLGSDAMKALGPAIGGLLAAPPDLIFVDPILGKGL